MSQVDLSDGSEDVTDFLRRIKELGDKRDREDAERTRKLEEEIMEGRRQREARRAERARSLSPEKQSPAGTPRSPRPPRSSTQHDLPTSPILSPSIQRPSASVKNVLRSTHEQSNLSSSEPQNPASSEPPQNSSIPTSDEDESHAKGAARNPGVQTQTQPLSWQQRSNSLRAPRSKPSLSLNRASSPLAEPVISSEDEDISRGKIADRLSSKDASWFRQTPDRGLGSAAYRRNQDAAKDGTGETKKRQLPGMTSRPTKVNERVSAPTLLPSSPPVDSETLPGTQEPQGDDSKINAFASPLPLRESHRFLPPQTDHPQSDAENILSRPISTSPARSEQFSHPISPTKGIGGFVQSAMLKRSDSVNKRWTVQTPPTLSRQDSGAGIRPSSRMSQDLSIGRMNPSGSIRRMESPTKQLNSDSLTRNTQGTPKTPPRKEDDLNNATSVDTTPQHHRLQSAVAELDVRDRKEEDVQSPPSPSKRWSPVKSSWLESALSRPSSPQLTASSPQPSWLTELNKNKQQRNSRDLTSRSQTPEILPAPISRKTKSMPMENEGALSRSTPNKTPPTKSKPVPAPRKPSGEVGSAKLPALVRSPSPIDEAHVKSKSTLDSFETNPKPAVPSKTDFRSILKPLEPTSESADKGELEFQNVVGKLKRSHTGKYVPPDELKDNILRGKAALSASEGPQDKTRKDSLKDDIQKQREALAKKGAPLTDSSAIADQKPVLPPKPAKTASSIQPDSVADSKLASRFNPGLANLLAKRTAGGNDASNPMAQLSRAGDETDLAGTGVDPVAQHSNSGQLEHMTKGRARGPKRRLPKAGAGAVIDQSEPTAAGKPKPSLPKRITSNHNAPPEELTKTTEQNAFTSNGIRVKPQTSPKSSSVRKVSTSPQPNTIESPASLNTSPKSPQPLPSRPSKPSGLRSSSGSASNKIVADGGPKVVSQKADDADTEESTYSVKDATARWGRRTVSKNMEVVEEKAPIKLPTHADEQAERVAASPSQEDMNTQNGSEQETISKTTPQFARSTPSIKHPDYSKSLRLPPKVGAKSTAAARSLSASMKPYDAPSRAASLAQETQPDRMFADFFSESPRIDGTLDLDTQRFLKTDSTGASKVKTLRKDINQISSDCKTTPLPFYQDHILFDQSMYMCTHIFGDSTGARTTEIYLWVGSSVNDASIEDVRMFADKAARDVGGKLIVFRQGKETPNFLQALGGILITRSGSAEKNNKDSYMLCGRRHLGHIAFDQVDLSPTNLCSGYPFIINSPSSNTIFVWKGCGCNPEELAGARLMSMDLGVTSKVIEIEEGRETPEFFAIFPRGASGGDAVPLSSKHWKLKAKNDNYNIRLFHVESATRPDTTNTMSALWNRMRQPIENNTTKRRPEITEIAPFSQADLEPENIYVLDAFFELYIILGPLHPPTKPETFATALLFAQDYAIQAAGNPLENRPFVPPGTVVLAGAPRDMRAVFRRWKEGVDTGALMAGRREEGVRVLGLGEAVGGLVR